MANPSTQTIQTDGAQSAIKSIEQKKQEVLGGDNPDKEKELAELEKMKNEKEKNLGAETPEQLEEKDKKEEFVKNSKKPGASPQQPTGMIVSPKKPMALFPGDA